MTSSAAEYLIALVYLALFVWFWRFVNGGPAGRQPATASVRPLRAQLFEMPPGVYFHPGHAWLRADGEVATIGLDDLAGRLVGPPDGIRLPAAGSSIGQGEKGWTLAVGGDELDMLSPVDGTVVDVNRAVIERPALAAEDPYGAGWLLKVKSSRLRANLKQLVTGGRARRLFDEACHTLCSITPGFEGAYQDGGTFVSGGIFRHLDPDRRRALVRALLLT